MFDTTIQTMPGVLNAADAAGTVVVAREDGSTMVGLTVTNRPGDATATVFLDYRQVASLMIALGGAAAEI